MGKYRKLKSYILNELGQLSPDLRYHGLHHTEDVLRVCEEYIHRHDIPSEQRELLRIAALMHDMGFLYTYRNHEEKAVEIAHQILPDYGYSSSDITIISGLIMATKVPQNPQTPLEQVICDADLDYLGREDFYPISETLYVELTVRNLLQSREQWDQLQVSFLENHRFHTDFAKKHREPQKQLRLAELKKRLRLE